MTTNKHDRKEGQLVTAVWRNGGFSASYDSFVVGSSAVLRLNFCAKNPPLRQAAKRYRQAYRTPQMKIKLQYIKPFYCGLFSLALNITTSYGQDSLLKLKELVHSISIEPQNTDFTDLSSLGNNIGEKKIVMLGEQHGDGSVILTKIRLVKYLHEKLGFNTIFFESSLSKCGILSLYNIFLCFCFVSFLFCFFLLI